MDNSPNAGAGMTADQAIAAQASHDVLPPWIALVIYVAGFAITARVAFSLSDGYDRAEDRVLAVTLGVLWPVALAIAAACCVLVLPTLRTKTKLDRRERAAALERKIRERDRRIAQLEREAGIQP